MHSYLRSIGFSELERKELDQILKKVITQYDEKTVIENSEGHLFVEVSKIFGCDVGITVCGEYDENNEFEMEYYFPFFRGTGITTQENVLIERHVGKESYAGAVDDIRIGVTIIFYLQNAAEYLTEHRHGHYTKGVYPVTLAGLAREARILLPVKKDEKQQREERENTVRLLLCIYIAGLVASYHAFTIFIAHGEEVAEDTTVHGERNLRWLCRKERITPRQLPDNEQCNGDV